MDIGKALPKQKGNEKGKNYVNLFLETYSYSNFLRIATVVRIVIVECLRKQIEKHCKSCNSNPFIVHLFPSTVKILMHVFCINNIVEL